MYFDSKELIDFCAKKKITVEQFLLCYLVHTEKNAEIYKYCEQVRPFPQTLIENLHKKGLVINTSKKNGHIEVDDLIITDSFTEDLQNFLGELSDELFDLFPNEVSVGGKAFNGKTISRENLELVYHKKMQRAKVSHSEIMKALREQIDNGTLGMGLQKWFETEQWNREDNTIDITDDL